MPPLSRLRECPECGHEIHLIRCDCGCEGAPIPGIYPEPVWDG